MRLKNVTWAAAASAVYLRLLSAQRQGIDDLVRGLRELSGPPDGFRPVDEYPGYWFARTPNELLMVIRERGEDYVVMGFADWRQQYTLAVEEAAAALAAEVDGAAEAA